MKSGNEWVSISDMMTGLMMVFLFITVIYIQHTRKNIQEYRNIKETVYQKLGKEFGQDLKKWNAELIKDDLIIRFLSPQIMFEGGESTIKPQFKTILTSFCPRYFRVLFEFDKEIKEVRIEGHTSNEWHGVTVDEAYFKNMELSQDRTRSVLEYCVDIKKRFNRKMRKWAIKSITANGLSSSRPLCVKNNRTCREKNRRVDFRVQVRSHLIQANQNL